MSEELNQEVEVQTPAEKQLSPMEQKALEQGWRPKEEFTGNPDAFIDAAEFVRRGELFSKIEHQSKELKQVRQALEALKEHHSKVKETEYKRALASLDSARKQALAEGETERFFALEEKIEEVKAEKAEFDAELKNVPTNDVPQPPQEFVNWVNQNKWYETDKAMRAYADRLGAELASSYPPATVLQMVEKEVKKEFAHKLTNPKTSRPMAVEPSGRGGTKTDSFVLSPDERDVMRKFVRSGVMTEQEYIAELKKVKGS